MRISTQVFVRVEGQRKVMTFTDPAGVTRPLEVEIDLDQCADCGALLPPGDLNVRHQNWHIELRACERCDPGQHCGDHQDPDCTCPTCLE